MADKVQKKSSNLFENWQLGVVEVTDCDIEFKF